MGNYVSISGPLWQYVVKHQLIETDVHASELTKPSLVSFHPMSRTITSVTLAPVVQFRTATMKMTYREMGGAVAPQACAVHSTILHGPAIKTLSQPTTEDIELRLCAALVDAKYNEDLPIELVEVFVQ